MGKHSSYTIHVQCRYLSFLQRVELGRQNHITSKVTEFCPQHLHIGTVPIVNTIMLDHQLLSALRQREIISTAPTNLLGKHSHGEVTCTIDVLVDLWVFRVLSIHCALDGLQQLVHKAVVVSLHHYWLQKEPQTAIENQ